MIKKALEIPDDISQWEDTIMNYMDKNFPYLSDGLSNISFSKKEENSKDGVGAVQYKNNGLEITIPIIIDDGDLKEPNLGIYQDQIIPISEDMFKWIMSNTQNFGQLIQRDSQHISNVDYLQQTGLFEEPEGGGYVKSACYKATVDRICSEANKYPETKWIAEKLSKIAEHAPEEHLVGHGLDDQSFRGIASNVNEYVTAEHKAGSYSMPKIATVVGSAREKVRLDRMFKAESPYMRASFVHKYASTYPMLKKAEEGGEGSGEGKENELIQIASSDTFGQYDNVLASERGITNSYSGRVWFDVKPLIERKKTKAPIVMMLVDSAPKEADPEPDLKDSNTPNCSPCAPLHTMRCVLGDIYGVKKGYHSKKADECDDGYLMEKSYDMGDNIMIRLGKNSYTIPYMIDTKASGMVGLKMEHVIVISVVSPLDYTKADLIISDVPELRQIKKTAIKDRQLLSMMKTEAPFAYLVPSGSIVHAPSKILIAADKGKMISDIINGAPETNMSLVVKVAGSDKARTYDISFDGGTTGYNYHTGNEKVANALASYFVGEDTTAEKIAAEGKIPLEHKPERVKLQKIAQIIADNTDAYIAAAAKLPRSISPHFAKVASVGSVVDGLIGVSFVDSAKETDTNKIGEQIMSLINSLGNLILMARLGKTSIPEADVNRAFWSLAGLLNVIRG